MIDVKIIQQTGRSALVQWVEDGKLKRATIPVEVIKDNQVLEVNLNMGIPYGLNWASLIELSATSECLEQELHRVGVWTAEDALGNAEKIRGAIQKTYSVDLGKIMAIAKQERSK